MAKNPRPYTVEYWPPQRWAFPHRYRRFTTREAAKVFQCDKRDDGFDTALFGPEDRLPDTCDWRRD